MSLPKEHSFNYYFLNKHIFTNLPEGYRQTVINILINKNNTDNYNKLLFVQEKGGTWGFTRQGIVEQNIAENLFETLVKNMGEELGFKGISVIETKPTFLVKSYFFDIQRQEYDDIRAEAERLKNRPSKGKLYHLAIIEYKGPDKLPIDPQSKEAVISDYKWVTVDEARNLLATNVRFIDSTKNFSPHSIKFHSIFFEKIIKICELVKTIRENDESVQPQLL